MLLVTLSLVMLLTAVVPVQARPVQQQSPAERLDLVPEDCDIPEHRPGEFRVYYDSEAALRAAPEENVVEETAVDGPGGGVFEQRLVFEEIKKEPGPEKRRVMEEVEKQKLEGRSGVTHVGYVWAGGGSCEGHPAELVLQSRQKLFEYVCSPEGLEELFGKDDDAQRRLCEDREPDPETCAPKERPGELQVYYKSEEDAPAVPKENVVVVEEAVVIRGGPPRFGPPPLGSGPPDSGPPGSGPPGSGEELFMQHLLFKEIEDEKDLDKQRAAHEAKKRELLEQWPGVVDVEGLLETPQGEECIGSGVSRVLLYVCGLQGLEKVFWGDVDLQFWLCFPNGGGGNNCYPNCNKGIVERARKIIGGGRSDAGGGAGGGAGGKAGGKAGGRVAFDAAYEAARSGGSGGGEATSTTRANPGGSGTGDRGVSSAPGKPERAKAGKKDADAEADAKRETGEAADDSDEEVDPYVGGSGSGAGAKGPGGGGEAAGAGLRGAGEGPGEAGEVSLDGDAADEREGRDSETGGYLTGFLSDAFYFVSDGNLGPANERAGGTDAAGKETATSETATSETATDEARDGVLSFLSDPFRGDRGGGAEGGDVGLGDAENAAASRDRRTDASTMVLGVGALLAAGVLVARGFFWR